MRDETTVTDEVSIQVTQVEKPVENSAWEPSVESVMIEAPGDDMKTMISAHKEGLAFVYIAKGATVEEDKYIFAAGHNRKDVPEILAGFVHCYVKMCEANGVKPQDEMASIIKEEHREANVTLLGALHEIDKLKAENARLLHDLEENRIKGCEEVFNEAEAVAKL